MAPNKPNKNDTATIPENRLREPYRASAPSTGLGSTVSLGSFVCDRWGGEDSPACNEDGSPAIVDGDEVIVRDYWEDEYGSHFRTERHAIDGKRFYWSLPN